MSAGEEEMPWEDDDAAPTPVVATSSPALGEREHPSFPVCIYVRERAKRREEPRGEEMRRRKRRWKRVRLPAQAVFMGACL